MSESSLLATDFQRGTAAKAVRSFIYCMCRLIREHDGSITAFDGDRVMGIFVGKRKNSRAVTSALKMNYVMSQIVAPKLISHFQSLKESEFEISHCVGIDTSNVLAVRAGQRGANDLVWIGRAPNLAAKLSEIREESYRTYISDDVFKLMDDPAKYGGDPPKLMWEPRTFEFLGESISVHRSSWRWKP
jgi:class 3 adenylate cyclase